MNDIKLGYLIGVLFLKGTMLAKEGNFVLSLRSKRKVVVEKVAKILGEIGEVDMKVFRYPSSKNISYGTRIYSRKLVAKVIKLMENLEGELRREEFVKGFLKGVLESKGSYSLKVEKRNGRVRTVPRIRINSVNREKLRLVKGLLGRLGINASLSRAGKLWQLEIKGKFRIEKLDEIVPDGLSNLSVLSDHSNLR